MRSIYGWDEDSPPRWDEDAETMSRPVPLQVFKAAVAFDMVHRYSDTPEEHDRVIKEILEGEEAPEELVDGFIRLLCASLGATGPIADPDAEYRAFLAAIRAASDEENSQPPE